MALRRVERGAEVVWPWDAGRWRSTAPRAVDDTGPHTDRPPGPGLRPRRMPQAERASLRRRGPGSRRPTRSDHRTGTASRSPSRCASPARGPVGGRRVCGSGGRCERRQHRAWVDLSFLGAGPCASGRRGLHLRRPRNQRKTPSARRPIGRSGREMQKPPPAEMGGSDRGVAVTDVRSGGWNPGDMPGGEMTPSSPGAGPLAATFAATKSSKLRRASLPKGVVAGIAGVVAVSAVVVVAAAAAPHNAGTALPSTTTPTIPRVSVPPTTVYSPTVTAPVPVAPTTTAPASPRRGCGSSRSCPQSWTCRSRQSLRAAPTTPAHCAPQRRGG